MRHWLNHSTGAAILLLSLTGAIGCASDDQGPITRSPDRTDSTAARARADAPRTTTEPSTTASGADLVRNTLAIPTGDRATSILLVEKIAPREARLNRPFDYRIRVTNLTDTPLAGVAVRERLPENFAVSKSEPAARDDNGWFSYPVGELAARGSRTIDVSGVAKGEGTLNTCIAVDYKPTLCATTDVVNPILKLTKEGPGESDICEGIRYRYVVSNVGTGTEHDVTIEDVLPDGVTTDDGKKTIALRVGDVPQSSSKELFVRVKPSRTGQFASSAVVRAPGAPDVRSAEVSTTVRQPKLEVAVEGPPSEYLNKAATYTVTVKNTGDAPARRTILGIETAGQGEVATVAVTGAPGTAGGDAQVASYKKEGTALDTIAPGESKTVRVVVRATKEGRLPIQAAVVATCVTPVTSRTTTEILTLPALRLEVVDVEDPIRVGDEVTYRVSVKNQGTGADHNVAITATLPDELQFVSANGATDAKQDGQTLTFTPVPSLAAGQQAQWQIRAKATKPGDVRLQVQLKSDALTKPATETEPTRLY